MPLHQQTACLKTWPSTATFLTPSLRRAPAGVGGPNLRAAAERLAGSPEMFDAAPAGAGLPGNLAAPRPAAACMNAVTALAVEKDGRRLRKTVDDSLWNFPPHQDPGCAQTLEPRSLARHSFS